MLALSKLGSDLAVVALMLSQSAMPTTAAAHQNHFAITLQQVSSPDARDIQVRTDVKNVSHRRVFVMTLDPISEYTIIATRPDGKPAPFTKAWKEIQDPATPHGGSQVQITLHPQQDTSETWNLSDYVDFSRPGAYHIRVTRSFTPKETVSSNTIVVTIH